MSLHDVNQTAAGTAAAAARGFAPGEPDAGGGHLDDEKVVLASKWKLIWWGLKKHKLAMLGLIATVLLYLVALFADFLAPYPSAEFNADYTYAPPQMLQVWDSNEGLGPYVHGVTAERDPETLQREFERDPDTRIELGWFVRGGTYSFLGLFDTNIHLFGPKDPNGPPAYLLGADHQGRDMLSRLIHGTRVSMSIGLVGVILMFLLGIVLGGISGYVGGGTDTFIQRLIEFIQSIPTLPLFLALAAAIPRDWGPITRFFAITVVLAIVGWTQLAREVRSRFLALREEEFVTSARLDGARRPRIIFGHMLPSVTSHLIATITLAIPAMILGETALSFLGLGLHAPAVSWGVLLQNAQQVQIIAGAPWLLLPGVAVVVAVLALNFLGDGLRDAADPYRT